MSAPRPANDQSHCSRFLNPETKTRTGTVRDDQKTWLANVLAAGGLAGIARSVEDVERILGL